MCVYIMAYIYIQRLQDNLRESFSPSTVKVLGLELRSSGFVASAFTQWAIYQTLVCIFLTLVAWLPHWTFNTEFHFCF